MRSVPGSVGDELDQNPARRVRVEERDVVAPRARPRLFVDEFRPALPGGVQRFGDRVDDEGDVVHALPLSVEEPGDHRLGIGWFQELEIPVADVEKDEVDPAGRLLVHDRHVEDSRITLRERVRVRRHDTEMIEMHGWPFAQAGIKGSPRRSSGTVKGLADLQRAMPDTKRQREDSGEKKAEQQLEDEIEEELEASEADEERREEQAEEQAERELADDT